MIIKSHIRGGYRAAADYLKDIGQNEATRLVSISDHDAKTLDQAFHNMWAIACQSRVKKPLHHISINPMKHERLPDDQVRLIVERCEQAYGYKPDLHQRVIVEHVKDGRQHFHVIWNRVSLKTGKAVWPGHHWKKSKQLAREMERELGLKRPVSKRTLRKTARYGMAGKYVKHGKRYSKRSRKGGYSKYGKSQTNSETKPWGMSKVGANATGAIRYRQTTGITRQIPAAIDYQIANRSGKIGELGKFWNTPSNFLFPSTAWKPNFCTGLIPACSGGSIGLWGLPLIAEKQVTQNQTIRNQSPTLYMSHRPSTIHVGMSEAQRIDYLAACEGKITWRQYFMKWESGGLGL